MGLYSRHLWGCNLTRVAATTLTPPCACTCACPTAALDASEGQRVQAYSTPDAAEVAAVYDIVHKLACVAQSFGGSGGGGGDVRSLQKQLRRLKAEAGEAMAEAQAPAGLQAL